MESRIIKDNTNYAKPRFYFAFLRREAGGLLLGSIVLGLSLFLVEFAFAYLLQLFLIRVGALPPRSISVPGWLLRLRFSRILGIICFAGLTKGLLVGAQQFLLGLSIEGFKLRQRNRVINWGIQGKTTSSAQATYIFGEQINSASLALQAIQAGALYFVVSLMFLLALLWLSPVTTSISVILLALILIPSRMVTRGIRKLGKHASEEWIKSNSSLLSSLKNLLLIQIYGTQRLESTKASESLRRNHGKMLKIHALIGINSTINGIVNVGIICLMTLPVVFKFRWMSSGLKLSYFYLYFRFAASMSQLVTANSSLSSNWHSFAKLSQWYWQTSRESLIGASAPVEGPVPDALPIELPLGWDILNISYVYPDANVNIIQDLSLSIEGGKIICISGRSGIGKSTLLNLILGTLAPSSGSIEVRSGERHLSMVKDRAQILSNIGYVGPENFIMEGSIEQNLRYGLSHNPTEDELWAALELAQCGFARKLLLGLKHPITDQGQGLSAGQKQRLALARALLRKPKALVLDEATANLDFQTEMKVIDTFLKLRGQVTIIAATHRRAIAEMADLHIAIGPNGISAVAPSALPELDNDDSPVDIPFSPGERPRVEARSADAANGSNPGTPGR